VSSSASRPKRQSGRVRLAPTLGVIHEHRGRPPASRRIPAKMSASLPPLLLGLGFGSLLGTGFWLMGLVQRKLGRNEDGSPKSGGQLTVLLVNGPLAALMLYVLVHAGGQLQATPGPQAIGFASMLLACVGVAVILSRARPRRSESSDKENGH
jgi:hypothetical protein